MDKIVKYLYTNYNNSSNNNFIVNLLSKNFYINQYLRNIKIYENYNLYENNYKTENLDICLHISLNKYCNCYKKKNIYTRL